ncbi:MAG: hypothetical protein JWN56_1921 [Sphingobacteriales bacterium]|nr:hypothetical protein [Sphingobacteriales bacterium]
MGFHADQMDILEANTGIAIISLRQTRALRFRNLQNNEQIIDYELVAGSLFYMTPEILGEMEACYS